MLWIVIVPLTLWRIISDVCCSRLTGLLVLVDQQMLEKSSEFEAIHGFLLLIFLEWESQTLPGLLNGAIMMLVHIGMPEMEEKNRQCLDENFGRWNPYWR